MTMTEVKSWLLKNGKKGMDIDLKIKDTPFADYTIEQFKYIRNQISFMIIPPYSEKWNSAYELFNALFNVKLMEGR